MQQQKSLFVLLLFMWNFIIYVSMMQASTVQTLQQCHTYIKQLISNYCFFFNGSIMKYQVPGNAVSQLHLKDHKFWI